MQSLDIPNFPKSAPKSLKELTQDLPAMPMVTMRAMRELGDPDIDARTVAKTISMDQSMTSRLLRVANSPVFGSRRQIRTVNDALVLLGFSAVKGLIIAVSTRGIFKSTGLMEQLLWEHSIGCALAATAIARATDGGDPEGAFVGGLIHDIGRSVFSVRFHDEYELLFQHIYNANLPRTALIDLEVKYLGTTHMELGAAVGEKWCLDDVTVEEIKSHHATTADELNRCQHPTQVATVSLANAICSHLAIGTRRPDNSIPLYDSASAELLGIKPEALATLSKQVLETFDAEKSTFDL